MLLYLPVLCLSTQSISIFNYFSILIFPIFNELFFTQLLTNFTNLLFLFLRPVLVENLFQLPEDFHNRRGWTAFHYHSLVIYDIMVFTLSTMRVELSSIFRYTVEPPRSGKSRPNGVQISEFYLVQHTKPGKPTLMGTIFQRVTFPYRAVIVHFIGQ